MRHLSMTFGFAILLNTNVRRIILSWLWRFEIDRVSVYSLGVLELRILLSFPPKGWNYSPILSFPAKNSYFVDFS